LRIRIVLATLVVAAAVAAVISLTLGSARSAPVGAGVVVIETSLGFQDAHAAGTGMVLTSSGAVLTNNHVIRGATDIRVVVPKTGRSFPAKVVGYDESDDVSTMPVPAACAPWKPRLVSITTTPPPTAGRVVSRARPTAAAATATAATTASVPRASRMRDARVTVRPRSPGRSRRGR